MIFHVKAISHIRVVALPSISQSGATVVDSPRAVRIAKPRTAHRILLALGQS